MEQYSHNRVDSLLKRENERQQDVQKKKDEKNMGNAEHEQYGYFNQVFDKKHKDIEMMLDTAPNMSKTKIVLQFNEISKELHLLQKFVADSVLFLRGYDIRICQASIQELESKMRKLEEILLPKKRFGFKNKRTIIEPVANVPSDEVDNVKKPIHFEENFFGFKNQENETLKLENNSLYKKDVSLDKLTNCIVVLPGTPSTLHMSSIKNCLVICGPVSTSVFADNCTNCKLVLACQQLRLHNSSECDIYLHVTSKAIIEYCTGIKVTPYNYLYNSLSEDFKKSGLAVETNNWDSLDDFNWLVADKKSPNWSVLEDSARICDWEKFINSNML